MNKKLLIITLHCAAWACFFLLPIVFFPHSKDPKYQMSDTFKWMFFCIDVYLVIFYYFNTEVIIPYLLAKKRWLWYSLAIIACLSLFIMIPTLFENSLNHENPGRAKFKMGRRSRSLYPFTGSTAVFFLVFTVSTCIKVIQQWLSAEQREKLIETEKLNTELSFLKSQINPHFLFNTLNNIYSLAIVKSDETAAAVMKLSSIMRYVLSDTKQHLVPLEKEIEFIQHYIDLQNLRLTDKIKINFIVNGEQDEKQIAPLLFIPFVENAFKYGISTKEHSEINITINIKPNEIEFITDNRILALETDAEKKNGIGLKNTRRRLEILYADKHTLEIHRKEDHFYVNLKITQ